MGDWLVPHASAMVAGRYRLRGQIAAGGLGEVWRADDLVLRRAVAVKLLRRQYAGHPQTLAPVPGRSPARRVAVPSGDRQGVRLR